MAEKRGRERVNIVQPDRDISRKKDGPNPSTPGVPLPPPIGCIPTDGGDWTISGDCSQLLNPEGVLYAEHRPPDDLPATFVVQWTYSAGSAMDDFIGAYQFGAHVNVEGGFCRTKGLQPGIGSSPVPIVDDSIEYIIQGSIANWFGDPENPSFEAPRYLMFQWRAQNSVLAEVLLATSTGNRNWVLGLVHATPPPGTDNIRFRTPNANAAWDNVAVSYETPIPPEDPTNTIIPPSLGRVYNQIAGRVDGDTYTLCIDASHVLEVKIDGLHTTGWTFDGVRTITLPTSVSGDTEVWVRFIA